MSYQSPVSFITGTSRAATTFNGTYQTLGAALTAPCFYVQIFNNTDQDVLISIDGTNLNDTIPTLTTKEYNFSASQTGPGGLYFPQGTQFYVNASVGTGTIYLTGMKQGR